MKKHRRFRLFAGIVNLKKMFFHAEWESTDSPCNDDIPSLGEATPRQIDLEPIKVNLDTSLAQDTAA